MGSINNPAITVGEMQALGVDSVEAHCCVCGNRWPVPIDFLPAATTLSKVAELIVCPTCGSSGVKVSLALAESAV